MNFRERLADICSRMREDRLDLLVGLHDGAHFIETPNPVMVLSGFKSLGATAVLLRPDDETTVLVTPPWDAERAAECCPGANVRGVSDVVAEVVAASGRSHFEHGAIGVAGLRALPAQIAGPITKEIPRAREADNIKTLGAEDNFLLLCAGPHNRAVALSNGRRLQHGDIILAEITPSVRGQLTQICRTVVVGEPSDVLACKYDLVVHAMDQGIAAAVPGVAMSEVCRAINLVLEAEGYGEFCHPPYIRRRGHGLGFGSMRPGDVALDNATVLEPDMLFMIHPNQYLPETGYLLCGEPVLQGARGAATLTKQKSALTMVDG